MRQLGSKNMEYSSLEEAYPNVETKHLNISDLGPETKKKSKKSKSKQMPLSYFEESADIDPDRQGCRRMPYVEAFQDVVSPVAIQMNNAKPNKGSVPNYFGKGVDDTEAFANYSNVIGDDPTYRLTPDFIQNVELKETGPNEFAKQFLGQGLDKPAGAPNLPAEPNLDMAWKPSTAEGVPTAAFKVAPPGTPRAVEGRDEELHKKIDDLYRRIADLDRQRNVRSNAQTEVLLFVGSGLALILFLHGMTAGRR